MSCPDCTDVGDTVMLVTGGPLMTVTDLSEVYAECSWFDGDSLQQADLPYQAIVTVGDDEPAPGCQPNVDGLSVGAATGWGAI